MSNLAPKLKLLNRRGKQKTNSVNQWNSRMVTMLWSFHRSDRCLSLSNSKKSPVHFNKEESIHELCPTQSFFTEVNNTFSTMVNLK